MDIGQCECVGVAESGFVERWQGSVSGVDLCPFDTTATRIKVAECQFNGKWFAAVRDGLPSALFRKDLCDDRGENSVCC